MKKVPLYLGAVLLLTQVPAWAFGGCADSPENPSLVLGLLGGAAAGARYLWQARSARRSSARNPELANGDSTRLES
jgi:XrtJ-associated TM-motif-TM protein